MNMFFRMRFVLVWSYVLVMFRYVGIWVKWYSWLISLVLWVIWVLLIIVWWDVNGWVWDLGELFCFVFLGVIGRCLKSVVWLDELRYFGFGYGWCLGNMFEVGRVMVVLGGLEDCFWMLVVNDWIFEMM